MKANLLRHDYYDIFKNFHPETESREHPGCSVNWKPCHAYIFRGAFKIEKARKTETAAEKSPAFVSKVSDTFQ
jgi:hypothetical protein